MVTPGKFMVPRPRTNIVATPFLSTSSLMRVLSGFTATNWQESKAKSFKLQVSMLRDLETKANKDGTGTGAAVPCAEVLTRQRMVRDLERTLQPLKHEALKSQARLGT
jgi:hypothetical protein